MTTTDQRCILMYDSIVFLNRPSSFNYISQSSLPEMNSELLILTSEASLQY
jgi:hypothetical protein